MLFEQRQAAWTGDLREFKQLHGLTTKPVVWRIWVEGARLFTVFGQEGGQFQATDYLGKAKNVGKKNEISPEQDALAEARRECRKKADMGGMDEFKDGVNLDNRFGDDATLNIPALLDDLPGSFALYKPVNIVDKCPKLLKLIEEGSENVLWTLKRNGEALFSILNSSSEVDFYSRRARRWHHQEGPKELADGTLDYSKVVLWNERFGYLIEQVKALQLPPSTFLANEVCLWRDGVGELRRQIGSVMRSKTAEAMAAMETGGYPGLYIWDIPFHAGEDLVSHRSVSDRYGLIHDLLKPVQAHVPHISGISWARFKSLEESKAYAREHNIEGWGVVDRRAIYGDAAYNFTGSPRRPTTFGKDKPDRENDFVANWDPDNKSGKWGNGDNEKGKMVKLEDDTVIEHGGVGSIALYQYNTKKELIFICNCGSGMSMDFQARLRREHFPMVVECRYTSRTYMSEGEKTNALEFPRFVGPRPDKPAEDCVDDDL